jgi:hypothetical protein
VKACEEVANGPIYGSLKAKLKNEVAEIFAGASPELCLTPESLEMKRGSEGEHVTVKSRRKKVGTRRNRPVGAGLARRSWVAGLTALPSLSRYFCDFWRMKQNEEDKGIKYSRVFK